jgi:hypothetical protein
MVLRLWLANSYSCRNRSLVQPAAVLLRYESNLTRLHFGVSIGGVPARAAWVRLDDPAIETLSALKKKAAIPVRLPSL